MKKQAYNGNEKLAPQSLYAYKEVAMYKYILFDLDGTLTDPAEGITNSVAYALKKFDIEIKDKTELYKFIGPPLQASFKEFYGFNDEQSTLAIEYYREYFRDKGMFENKVYDEIPELLQTLKSDGHTLIVATSKPEKFAMQILEHFDLIKYFDFVAGASMDGSLSAKADIIKYALEKNNITDLKSTIMVGDRKHDIIGAIENNIDSIGVLFGYGSKEELEQASATYISEIPIDIIKLADK